MSMPNLCDMKARPLRDVTTPHVLWKWAAGFTYYIIFTRGETRFNGYWKRHWISPLYIFTTLWYFFFLVGLKSQVDLRLLDSLLPFFPIPTYFSPIHNSSRLTHVQTHSAISILVFLFSLHPQVDCWTCARLFWYHLTNWCDQSSSVF